MKVLFLDVDGVLNVFEMGRPEIDRQCVAYLQHILRETGTKIVLSSSWRHIVYRGEMTLLGFRTLLRTHGLYGADFIGMTTEEDLEPRGWQIRRWCRENGYPEAYCILDDDDDHISEAFPNNFVRTQSRLGLTAEKAQEAITILNRPPHRQGAAPLG